MKTKQIAIDAMLAAMCAALGFVSIDLGAMKFTFESFPIILGALFFGPIDGMVIASLGTFLSQYFHYGLDPSTIIWIIPYVVYGLVIGLARKKNLWLVVILSGVLLTLLNTAGLFVYNKWLGGSSAITFISFIIRIVTSLIKSVLFVLVIKKIWNSIEKVSKNSQN